MEFTTSTWQQLEEVVEKLQRQFHKNARVKRNDFILGRKSNTKRQIDVSIRYELGTSSLLIIVECKRRKAKVDAPQMEAFIAKMSDVGAHQGIVVSERGFTRGAKNLATGRGVEIYTLRDTQKANWHANLRIRFFVEAYTLHVFSFAILDRHNVPMQLEAEETVHLIDSRTNREITLDEFVRDIWRREGRPEDEFCLSFSCSSTTCIEAARLEIGIRPKVVRFSKPATFEYIGLVDAQDETTHTDRVKMVTREDSQVEYASDPHFWKMSDAIFGMHIQSVAVSCRRVGDPMRAPEKLAAMMPQLRLEIAVTRENRPIKFASSNPENALFRPR
jgi:hypothetical protein